MAAPPNYLQDIRDFHEKFDLAYDGKPRLLPTDLASFREKFMREELDEWADQGLGTHEVISDPDHHDVIPRLSMQLDAMVDLAYVLFGTVHQQGFELQFEEAWRRVHSKNMEKVRVERVEDSKRSSAYDVVKPPGWTPPCHKDLVSDHAHFMGA